MVQAELDEAERVAGQGAPGEGVGRVGGAGVLAEEVFQPRAKPVGRAPVPQRSGSRELAERASIVRMVGAPGITQRVRVEGQPVVRLHGAARLLGRDAARRNDERPLRGHGDRAFEVDRRVREQLQASGLAEHDRSVILAAAVCAHPAAAGQRAEVGAILDAAEITRPVFPEPDLAPPLLGRLDVAAGDQRFGNRDDERARTAHAGAAWERAEERDVGAGELAAEIPREAACHGHRERRPSACRDLQLRADLEPGLLAAAGIHHPDRPMPAGGIQHAEPTLDGAGQRGAACVVRVLAEHLDPAGHEEPARRMRGVEHVPGGLRLGKGDGMAGIRLDPCPKFGFVLWRRLALQLSQQARGFPLYLVPASAV